MVNAPHRIRRLRWLVNTGSLDKAFTLRQSLHHQWQTLLISACETVWDEAVKGAEIIHIPKLELQVRINEEDDLMAVLPELIQQQLQKQLSLMVQEGELSHERNVPGVKIQVPQTPWEVLLRYLQTGSVPWQVSPTSPPILIADLQNSGHQLRSQIQDYLNHQPETTAFYFRLIQLLPQTEFLALAQDLCDRALSDEERIIPSLIRCLLDTSQIALNRHCQGQLVATLLSESLRPSPQRLGVNFSPLDVGRSLDQVLSQLGIERNSFWASLPTAIASFFQPSPPMDRPSRPVATSPMTEIPNEIPKTDAIDLDVPRSPSEFPPTLPSETISDGLAELTPDRSLDSPIRRENPRTSFPLETGMALGERPSTDPLNSPSPEDLFPHFVHYAGLVLLHPFIRPFFEATGVKAVGSSAIAPSQLAHAASLLHFLATGQEEIHEFEIGLIKILLGLDLETPLLVGAGLISDSDREEAEVVLQATIRYWTVLKNTSIAGLRNSFLQRSGLLRPTEKGWRLQVEHQSFDLLLEQLPWTISIIKLSWMQSPLYTEWQTF